MHGYWPDETSLDSFLVFAYTPNATANATLFKVLFLGNGLRYLFEILDFEVWRLFALEMIKSLIRDDRLPMHVSHVQLFDFARGNKHNRKILIFGHVVIFYIENNIEKNIFPT